MRVRNIFICSDGGVLRLVENDEGVVQRAAAHEGDGRDLDDVLLEITVDLLRLQHVVQRVVERAKIGIDLLLQRAGQESRAVRRLRPPDAPG